MKSILSASLFIALITPVTLHAQTIVETSDSGAGNAGLTFLNEDSSNNPYPYYVQFGVSGANAGPTLLNPEAISGAPVVTVSPITESADLVPERTQDTSGIVFEYTNGTSPTSSTSLVTNESATTDQAGTFSVQTGFGGGAPLSGQTLSFNITFNQAVSTAVIALVANDFSSTSTATFTLSDGLPGQNSVSLSDPHPSGNHANDNFIYDVTVSNVAAGSVLNVSDVMTAGFGSGADNISISGVSFEDLETAPEPSTCAMLLGGTFLLLGMMHFRRATR